MSTRSKKINQITGLTERETLFIARYIEQGSKEAWKAYKADSPNASYRTAKRQAQKMLAHSPIAIELARRQMQIIDAATKKAQLTADEVVASLARDLRFDPAKLYDENGALKSIHDMDEDTRLCLRGMDIEQLKEGQKVVGYTVKVKFPEKNSSREQGMKHFGLYEKDNSQSRPIVNINSEDSGVL